ncbi:hypothetical protein K431DRAFT_347992 [Polychaeton citri CBS 116435]|uniref:Alpha/beta-hydrolase n=1 Tax=Polychaeton citri CBS 116435 TaxID=1314669 RepID=A0A9P4UNU1_9PEZI|nr:hypothetical protein K431DRAFT_347992 [Polychaeton citri CBS 116435]
MPKRPIPVTKSLTSQINATRGGAAEEDEKVSADGKASKTLIEGGEERMRLVSMTTTLQRAVDRVRQRYHNNAARQEHARLKALQVVKILQNEDWSDLRRQFHPMLRWLLRESVLRQGSRALHMSTGPITGFGVPQVSTSWLAPVKTPVDFKRTKMGMSHALGFGSQRIPPSYAAKSIRKVEIKFGIQRLRSDAVVMLPAKVGRYPCVVMLAGSGLCDKDSSVGSQKPFKDIALGLAAQGIVSIRFDKATLAHNTRLRWRKQFTLEEAYMGHALDTVMQAYQYEELSSNGIFIMGHSLDAFVDPRVMTTDLRVAGCIIVAGPSVLPCWSALRQLHYLVSLDKKSESTDHPEIDARNVNPIEKCRDDGGPVLVLQSGRDYQVTVQDDFVHWQAALADKAHVTMTVYDRLNHLFVAGHGQSTPQDYDQTGNVDEAAVLDICRWVTHNAH